MLKDFTIFAFLNWSFREKLGYNDTEYVDSHSIPRNNTVYTVQWITNTSCIHTSLDIELRIDLVLIADLLSVYEFYKLYIWKILVGLPIHFCVIHCSISPFSSIKPIQDREARWTLSQLSQGGGTLWYTVLQFVHARQKSMDDLWYSTSKVRIN